MSCGSFLNTEADGRDGIAGHWKALQVRIHASRTFTLIRIAAVVYAGGFLLMLPQVFVNYKLRSVAAMPWRAFVYRVRSLALTIT